MKRIVCCLVLAVGAIAVVEAQEPNWRTWRHEAPIGLPDATSTVMVAVTPGPDVSAIAARDWRDLRIVDDEGREVPYVVRQRRGEQATPWRSVRLLDPGFEPGRFTQVVIDTGTVARIHNRVRLDVAGEDFLTWMEIASGNDARTWQIVRERAPIYSLRQAGLDTALEAGYPDSTTRYLRLRLLDGARRFRIASASVAEETHVPAERRPVAITFAAQPGTAERSVWESTPASPGLSLSALAFQTDEPFFARPVIVEASDDRTRWQRVASGQISRVREGAGTIASLELEIPRAVGAWWRVTIYDRSDAPLAGLAISAFEAPRRLVFRQQPGRTYRLLMGHDRVGAPFYDLARQAADEVFDEAIDGTIGAVAETPGYVDPRPWTERHPVVLWAAVGLAIGVLAAMALRTLRRA